MMVCCMLLYFVLNSLVNYSPLFHDQIDVSNGQNFNIKKHLVCYVYKGNGLVHSEEPRFDHLFSCGIGNGKIRLFWSFDGAGRIRATY